LRSRTVTGWNIGELSTNLVGVFLSLDRIKGWVLWAKPKRRRPSGPVSPKETGEEKKKLSYEKYPLIAPVSKGLTSPTLRELEKGWAKLRTKTESFVVGKRD
jgi:hypothetical protein